MKGLELLKEELRTMGCTNSQAESKVVPIVLSICANNPNLIEIAKAEDGLNEVKREYDKALVELESLKMQCKEKQLELNRMECTKTAKEYYDSVDYEYTKIDQKINKFIATINNGETAESRDGLRKAQMFIQNVTVNTKYDNTAYIIGLAAILSNGAIEPIEELSKINTNFPSLKDNPFADMILKRERYI